MSNDKDGAPEVPDYDVGYGKPPKEHQFKKGICPKPDRKARKGKE